MKITWKTRRQAKTKEDATEALSDLVNTEYDTIINGNAVWSAVLLGRVQEYSEHWELPINAHELKAQAQKKFNEEGSDESYQDYERGWFASTC